MAVSMTSKTAVSASRFSLYSATISGYHGSLAQAHVGFGVMNPGPPATWGDLTAPGQMQVINMANLVVSLGPGQSRIDVADDLGWAGSAGDHLWLVFFQSDGDPVSGTPLLAVVGPIVVEA